MPEALFQARNAAYGLTIAFAFAVLGISAHWISLSVQASVYFNFEGLGMAAGGLGIIFLSIFLVVGLIRKNAFVNAIAVELPATVIISVLFLTEGVLSGNLLKLAFPFGCSPRIIILDPAQKQLCRELSALKGLSFASFAILIIYWLPVLVMTVIGLAQGQNNFGQSIREVEFSSHTQAQAHAFSNGIMEEIGLKESRPQHNGNGAATGMTYDQQQQTQQQQQLQLQQLQLQQLQQQQAMLQQQQQYREQV